MERFGNKFVACSEECFSKQCLLRNFVATGEAMAFF